MRGKGAAYPGGSMLSDQYRVINGVRSIVQRNQDVRQHGRIQFGVPSARAVQDEKPEKHPMKAAALPL